MKKRYVFVAVALVTLLLTASALAGGSLMTSYGGQGQQAIVKTTSATKSAQAKPAKAKASGTLPFTGVDLGVILATGAVLVLSGLALRRTARHKS